MNRNLKAKRIFSLGQYQNIELSDEFIDLPEAIAKNEVAIGLLSDLQLLNIERRVNVYYALREKYRDVPPEEAIKLIEDQIAGLKTELFEELNHKEN